MTSDTKLEIQWRKYLIARLEPVLKRVAVAVEKEAAERKARSELITSLYATPEEAHEAFGFGDITEDEYRRIADGAEIATTITARAAARDELRSIINRLKRDIRDFEWAELPEEEKERIRRSNEEYRAELEARKELHP